MKKREKNKLWHRRRWVVGSTWIQIYNDSTKIEEDKKKKKEKKRFSIKKYQLFK